MKEQLVSILMADDDLDDQYLVRRAIEDINIRYVLNTVNNGLQLLDVLLERGTFQGFRVNRPDCILLDLNMPLVDGFEALCQIRSNTTISDIPVFVLSTSRSDPDRLRALQMGATGFYVKPTEFHQLKSILGEICDKTQQFAAGKLTTRS